MNENEIRRWYDVFKDNHELVEIRVMPNGRKGMYSGYFTDIETILTSVRQYDRCNIYFTLNSVNEACYSREQRDRILETVKVTTSDGDIVGRDWCLIDIDVTRPAGTNATDEEVAKARKVGNDVYTFLRDNGFYSPVCCLSGNGVHLLYRQALSNTEENRTLMQNFLLVLDMLFSTDECKVDTTTFNASRICKLYGCVSRKGSASDPKRPQRESRIISVPSVIQSTDKAYFEKVAAMLPQQEKPSRYNGYSSESFDLDSFIAQYHIAVHSKSRFGNGYKYVLEECPFDSNHKAPDAALFLMDNGAIGFRCLHNSCQRYTWRDFRLHYDSNAYDRQTLYQHQQKMDYYSKARVEEFKPETKEKGKKWLQMSDIRWVDPSKLPFIPSGITELDKKIMGLMFGDVTIISGMSGAGKTSLIDNIILNVVQKGFKVAVWSGELQDFRFQGWIDQMAAGRNYVRRKEGYDDVYFATKETCERINRWLDGKLFLYSNNYGNHWEQLFKDIRNIVQEKGVRLVVIDNLMALSIDNYEGEKNERQTSFINDLKDYAKQENIHIILVAHPRKEQSFQLLRKDSISGTADLTNLADNVLIIHRVGRDFERRAKDFFGEAVLQEYLKYDVVVECAKNRSNGVVDLLVGLYYEKESRRLKNDMSEYIVYDWREEPRVEQSFGEIEPSHEFDDEEEIEDLPY